MVVPAERTKTLTQAIRRVPNHIKLLFKSLSALVFFIVGFNFSRTSFFEQYPLFNVDYLAEVMISLLAASIGLFMVPKLLLAVTEALETLIYNAINDIVSAFWDQQTKRIQDARREKQKKKSEELSDAQKDEIKHGILLDTSVLVDGRILDLVKTNFLENVFIVPQFVVDELHLISDSKEDLKRQKGRRGLDILKQIKRLSKVLIPNDGRDGKNGVDRELITYAKRNGLRLMTLDFNLNKVAQVSGVKVLNINDLSNAIKTVLLPGEEVMVKIIQAGKERQQGVGYLPDGTMIVVENTKDKIDQEVKAKVLKVIQSSAGKIIFCDLIQI